MTMDVRIPRMALEIIRASGLAPGCKHPAEALEHDLMRCVFLCSLCRVSTTEEAVARCLDGEDRRGVTFLDGFPPRWAS